MGGGEWRDCSCRSPFDESPLQGSPFDRALSSMLKVNSDSCLAGQNSSGEGSASQKSLPSNGSTAGSAAELSPSSAMRFYDSAYAEGEAPPPLPPYHLHYSDPHARLHASHLIDLCGVPYKGMCFNDSAYLEGNALFSLS